jgi:hypothetical protein
MASINPATLLANALTAHNVTLAKTEITWSDTLHPANPSIATR